MPKGKEIGEFSHHSTSATVLPGPGGGLMTQVNFEGTAASFGTVICTATFVGGNSGTFSFAGRAYLDNGDFATGTANGTFESVGANRWKTRAIVHVSDGADVLSEGEIDLAARSWSGKNYEWT